MFDFISGKTTGKSVFVFGALFAIVNTFDKAATMFSIPALVMVFFISLIVGTLIALLIGWIVSLFTKKKQHVVSIANWLLLIYSGFILALYFAFVVLQ